MRSPLRCFVALLLVLGVACSSGSKESAAKKPTTTTTTTTTTIKTLEANQVNAAASPYCATWAEIRKRGGPRLTGDPKKDPEVRKAHYIKLVPLAEKLLAEAASDIKPQVQYALNQVKEVASNGSDAPFQKPDAVPMQQKLAKYALDHCSKG